MASSWQASIDKDNSHTDHIDVNTTHLELGFPPEVFEVLQGSARKTDPAIDASRSHTNQRQPIQSPA